MSDLILYTSDDGQTQLHLRAYFVTSCLSQRDLPSFPTRRSSDLGTVVRVRRRLERHRALRRDGAERARSEDPAGEDRKSTRLNSSHVEISYAVFCLKKKTNSIYLRRRPNPASFTCRCGYDLA